MQYSEQGRYTAGEAKAGSMYGWIVNSLGCSSTAFYFFKLTQPLTVHRVREGILQERPSWEHVRMDSKQARLERDSWIA
jgi:hypothetical protein